MVARRSVSIRADTGIAGVSSRVTSAVSLLTSYAGSGLFHPPSADVDHGSDGLPLSSNAWQMNGGPASAGVAASDSALNVAAARTSRRVIRMMVSSVSAGAGPTPAAQDRLWPVGRAAGQGGGVMSP